jgi:lysophospholipid acyltransferase (LPLAT)-like uncharacterized protein
MLSMKIRNLWLIKAIGWAGAWVIRLWVGTLRYRYQPLGPNVDPHQPGLSGRYIYAFWHENMLLPAYQYGRSDIWVLISQHADGQMIAEACRHLGFQLVRGSKTRGGVEAVRQMLRLGRQDHLAITPDGPRGPRRRIQPGLIYLAAQTGLPIVPVGIGFRRPWRLDSWDHFALPRPWSRAVCVTTEPIVVPPGADKDGLEYYRQQVERALLEATEIAERWAESGQRPRARSQAVAEQAA